MNAVRQLHVSRRVLPIVTGLVPSLLAQVRKVQEKIRADGDEATEVDSFGKLLSMNIEMLVPGLTSAAEVLAGMPDEEFEYIQNACLAQVERERSAGTGWVPIWNNQAKSLQFQDIEGHEILLIVVEVLKQELAPFFLGLVSDSIGATQE